MTFLLAIGLGLTALIVGQLRIMKNIGDSVIAFHAADTGIERALYQHRKQESISDIPITLLPGGASYTASYYENIPTGESWWQSVGTFQGTKRAIEITHPVVFDFSLAVSDSSLCIRINPAKPSGSDTTIVTVTLISGTAQDITFSTIPSPPALGISVAFSPNAVCTAAQLTPSCSRTATFIAGGGVAYDTYTITIFAEAAGNILTKQVDIQLIIQSSLCPGE